MCACGVVVVGGEEKQYLYPFTAMTSSRLRHVRPSKCGTGLAAVMNATATGTSVDARR